MLCWWHSDVHDIKARRKLGWHFIFIDVADKGNWINSGNKLKLNCNETIYCVLLLTTCEENWIGSNHVKVFASARNLDPVLDSAIGMEKHANSKCKSCYYRIRNWGLIHKCKIGKTFKILVQALVISQLVKVPVSLINCLWWVQNRAQTAASEKKAFTTSAPNLRNESFEQAKFASSL